MTVWTVVRVPAGSQEGVRVPGGQPWDQDQWGPALVYVWLFSGSGVNQGPGVDWGPAVEVEARVYSEYEYDIYNRIYLNMGLWVVTGYCLLHSVGSLMVINNNRLIIGVCSIVWQ